MGDWDKFRWTPPAAGDKVDPPVVDPLAGASATGSISSQAEVDAVLKEVVEVIEHGVDTSRWHSDDEAQAEQQDGPGGYAYWTGGPSSPEPLPAGTPTAGVEHIKAAVGLAIADVHSTVHGEEPPEAAPRQEFDPATAAAVAAAMANVFTSLSGTRFATGQETPGQSAGPRDPLDINEVFSAIFKEAQRNAPAGPPEDQQAASEVIEADAYQVAESRDQPAAGASARDVPADDGPAEASARARVQEEPDAASRPPVSEPSTPPKRKREKTRQQSRDRAPYRGVRGRRKPPKLRIAKGFKAKGMRGSLDTDKTALNMAVKVKTLASPSRAIPLFLLACVMILAFSKFGVIDQMERERALQRQLTQLQEESQRLIAATADYDSVFQKYLLYGTTWMSEAELAQVDVMDVLAICDDTILPNARITEISMNNNLVDMTVSGINLIKAASLTQQLEDLPLVRSVSLQLVTLNTGETPAIPLDPAYSAPTKSTAYQFQIKLALPGAPEEAGEEEGGSINGTA
ncbi:hypothetical protein CE91St41_30000 [Oscillospiraceae bacterium]|nr:hypothetical protein CE91St40_30000 [Oscillospiraceae bacterium]BDF76111.1 hypothetical protein CE91St41_30000 [Oscillospiraceae bacterium]